MKTKSYEDMTLNQTTSPAKKEKEKPMTNIGTLSFLSVVLILVAVLLASGALSYFIPQGAFERDENGIIIPGSYVESQTDGISFWKVLTAPFRVFASEDALTVIVISIFLLIMSGIFNLLEKTGGIRILIDRVMKLMKNKGGPVVCVTVLLFMLFGSFFGMFEELVTLLPIIIIFMLSMNMDTMTGLGTCMIAACFGFSAAITNPFSVGLASQISGVNTTDGLWLRVAFFGIVYLTLCVFLTMHLKRIERNPKLSPSYEVDIEKRKLLESEPKETHHSSDRIFKVYLVFFMIQGVVLVLIATVRSISDLAIPILAASFLIAGIVAGLLVSDRKRDVARYIISGAVSMLPAVVMIALASSVKLVMTESGIIDTIMNYVIGLLEGKGKFIAILLIYLLILFMQFFIGSASAKIMLIMPIIMPIATALGLSPALVILAYCMADGFTDVILPTNPILLVGLSMANVSYGKWVKWTWKLQGFVFLLTIAFLGFGVLIGY